MVNFTRRKAIAGVGGLIAFGACLSAADPDDDDDVEASSDDTTDGNGGNGGNGDENGGNGNDNGNESVEEPDPQSFSGSGAAVEDGVSIEGGLTVVDASHSGGSGNFAVKLIPSEGEYDELFVNEIGEYGGETANLIEADTYQLDVEADGDWSIDVLQPRAASGDGLPQSLSDDRPAVYGPFEFGGSHTATGSHSGDGNFAVHVFPPEGQFGELVFNEIGSYDGETTFRHDGVGYVAVQGNGSWSLDLE